MICFANLNLDCLGSRMMTAISFSDINPNLRDCPPSPGNSINSVSMSIFAVFKPNSYRLMKRKGIIFVPPNSVSSALLCPDDDHDGSSRRRYCYCHRWWEFGTRAAKCLCRQKSRLLCLCHVFCPFFSISSFYISYMLLSHNRCGSFLACFASVLAFSFQSHDWTVLSSGNAIQ